jgi:iron complex outermembrane receptor protein
MRTHICFLVAIGALSLLPLSGANGQTSASPPNPSTEDSYSTDSTDAVVLSPFIVSTDKDTGYIAADTLNAGRLSTNLLMTPGNIDVMTRDLLNDLGVFNIDEASAWLTNARPLEVGAIESNGLNPGSLTLNDSGTNVSLRGLGANPSTRNYFTSGSTPKEYNVERVESARGPNSILYGEGGPGGSINYITKIAKSRDFTTVRLRFDDNSSKNVAFDVNRKLTKNLDARYNLNVLDKRYYIDRTSFKEIDHALNVVYRPFEGTIVTVSGDITRNTRPGLIMSYGEQYAKWDHQGVAGKLTLPAATLTSRGLANWTGAKYLTWVDGLGMMDLTGYAHTTGYGLPQPTENAYGDAFFPSLTRNVPGISSVPVLNVNFNANPKDIDVTDRSKDFQVSVNHTFKNKISVEAAGQYSEFTTTGGNYFFTTIYVDPLLNLPDGRVNPNFGKPYANSYVGRTVDYLRDSKSARLVAAYPLQLWGGTTTFSAFLLHQQKNDISIYTDLHIKDPSSPLSITDAASQIHVNRYFDNLTEELPDFRALYDTVDVPVLDARNHQKIQAVEVAASGSYFHDTLAVIAGFRRDSSELTSENGVVGTRDAKTGVFTQYTPDSRKAYNNTTTVGFVYFPIKYIGVYANHGEGFIIQTISNKRMDGSFAKANIVPASEDSVGLRFQLGGNSKVKIVGSVGYYSAAQENAARAVGVGNINTLWRDLGTYEAKDYSSSYIQTFNGDPFSTAATNSVTSTQSTEGKGWEASLTANLGNSFRLMLNGALPRTKQSAVAADYVAYVTQNFAAWSALANKADNPNRATDLGYVNQLQQTLTGFFEGRSQDRTYKYRANIFGIYTFNGSMLKGLRLGGGSQFYGKSQIGNQIGLPFNYVYSKEYYLLNAQVGYPITIGKYKMDVQLNIDNLLGYDDSIYNGLFVHTINGQSVNIPYGFKNVWPRAARLTVTIPF